jgi:VWFA-related protein
MRRRWPVLGVCLTFALAIGAAQQPYAPSADSTPSFRSGIDIVELDVSVLDKDRMPIRGLTVADFTVLEDGKPQPIVAFDAVDLPDVGSEGAAWLRDVVPDVATNRRDAQRVIVVVMDETHLPVTDPWALRTTKMIAHMAIDGMGPTDLAAVVYTFPANLKKGQEFTTDRTLLTAAVDRFVAVGVSPMNPFSGSERGRQSDPSANNPPKPQAPIACPGVTCVVRALRNAAEILEKWPGARKTVVLLSPGPINTSADLLEQSSELDDIRLAFEAMQQANVNVYQFDPLGLQVAAPANHQFGIFAENTGGRAVTNTNTPWTLVPQMFRENSSYYLLGFRSTNSKQDGHLRRLTVKVSRPDLEVRTRSGYFAPQPASTTKLSKELPPSALDRAVAGGLPAGDLPMTVTVAPFALTGKKIAAVAIVAGVDATDQTPSNEILEVRATAFQTDWKPAGAQNQKVQVMRPAPGVSIHADVGSRLDLPPGRYEVRVAIDSSATGTTGSAYTTVVVPDFSREPLSLSGLVIARGARSPAPGGVLTSLVPLVPTTVREFARSAAAVAFARIYQGGKQPVASVRVSARIVNETDRSVFERTSTLAPQSFGATRSADYRLDLPLADLEPGRYLFTVEVTAGKLSSRRDVRLAVKP